MVVAVVATVVCFCRGVAQALVYHSGPTAVRWFLKCGSLDLFDSDNEGVSLPMHLPTQLHGKMVESGDNSSEHHGLHLRSSSSSVGQPLRVAVMQFSKRWSFASIKGDSLVLASKTHVDADGRNGNNKEGKSSIMKDGNPDSSNCGLNSNSGLNTINDAGQHAANLKEGESSESNGGKPTMNDGKKGENSSAKLIVFWQQSR